MQTGLSLKLNQQLQLTPQLQQAIRLLQLSSLELQQEVEQQLLDNPFLEKEGPEAGDTADALPDGLAAAQGVDASTENIISIAGGADPAEISEVNVSENEFEKAEQAPEIGVIDWSFSDSSSGTDGDDDGDENASAQDLAHRPPSLSEHLHAQIVGWRLCAEDRAALDFLIANLDEDGYLDGDLSSLAQALLPPQADEALREQLMHHLTVALHLLQQLEPAGVGARDLAECLRLQLQHSQHRGGDPARAALYPLALQLCEQPLELLARKDVRRLTQLCAAPESEVRAALAWVAQLEPKPARRFVDVQPHRMTPDVLVQPSGAGFSVQLNPEVLPRLRVHEVYANALRGHRSSAGHEALQARLQEARWFVKSLTQRFDTILRVAQAIVQHQSGFLRHGAVAMRPLVLRDIAQELQLHESTISRVTNGKYMATPQGTFEFKYFFGTGLQTDTGGSASSTAVQALIAQLIASENPKKPLSDAKIADLLAAQGIECARRTVAKYREALRIPVASLRKSL